MTKTSRYETVLVGLMVFSVALENIKLFDAMGAAFKPTHVIFILAIVHALVKSGGRIPRGHFLILLLYLALPVLPLYRIADTTEWFKSYVIWCIGLVYLLVAFRLYDQAFQKGRPFFIRLFVYTVLVVQLLGIVQFVLMNFANVMFLADAFGNFQFSSSFVSMKSGFYRAFSVFHEPSVLGWVNSTQFAVLLYTQREGLFPKGRIAVLYALCVATAFISVSATAIIMIIAVYLSYVLIRFWSNALVLLGVAAGVFAFVLLWNFTDLLAPLARISAEYGVVGTSGYERMNAPAQYALRTLQYYPFLGRGIGVSGNVDAVGVIGDSLYETANNSFFEVVMNFGLSSVFLFVPLITLGIKTIRRNPLYLVLYVNLLGVLYATGAYLSLDFLVVLNITLFLRSAPGSPTASEASTDSIGSGRARVRISQ